MHPQQGTGKVMQKQLDIEQVRDGLDKIVRTAVTLLVNHPEDLEVESTVMDSLLVVTVTPHGDDIGKVLGKQGRTVDAMRSIMTSISAKYGYRCHLDVVD